MNYIKGKYRSSIFSNANGYTIGLFKVKETNDEELKDYVNKTITFTGYFSDLNIEDTFILYGELIYHDRYGYQYKVTNYEKVIPVGKEAVIEFLSSSLIQGSGEKTAIKIVESLGEDAVNKIKENYDNLLLVPGMTEKRAKKIYDSIMSYSNTDEVIIKLKEKGFSLQESLKLLKSYNMDIIDIVNNNPYVLNEFISFGKLDTIYLCDHDLDNVIRIKACIVETLKNLSFSNGDTFSYIDEIKDVMKLKYKISVSIDNFLEELIIENSIINIDNKFFLKENYEYEKDIARRLSLISKAQKLKILNFKDKIHEIEHVYNVNYSENQETAIKKALENNLCIITGGPGTGKTTIINAIVKLYILINKLSGYEIVNKIALLAPTGRASKRMAETTCVPATTIHRYLKWDKESNIFGINEFNKTEHDLIIIDETSMIDTYLFDSLLKGIKDGCKVILVGDSFQLPSVGPGLILNDLINSNLITHIELTKIYRQSNDSYIPILAKEIKENNLTNYKTSKDDYNFIDCPSIQLKKLLNDICVKSIKKGLKEKDLEVLIPMYKGENGIDNINIILKNIFNPSDGIKKEVELAGINYRENDKVLQLVNDPDNNIYNGDIGYISEIYNKNIKKYVLSVNYDGNYVDYKKEDLNNIKHAYAISIHKSQGSEFNHVILPITSGYQKMLYNKLIYTGVSRAKKSLIIIGDEKVFIDSIQNNYSDNRKTDLINRLFEYF